MLTERILCAGFGGQGVMSLGQMLAYAGMLEGKNVTWMPSYGPEMRGGTAYCSVVVSDEPVGSPIVTTNATSLIVMNLPSFERFEKSVVPGGLILMNSSLIDRRVQRRDVRVYPVAANELAATCGGPKASNMIMFGAYMALTGSPKLVNAIEAFKKVFGSRSAKMLTLNMKILEKGMGAVSNDVEPRKAA